MPQQQKPPLALYSLAKRSKSGRKINDQLPETPSLKSGRRFRARCAARLEEFEVLKKETLPKIYAAILKLEAEGNVLQTVSQIKSLLSPHLDDHLVCHSEFAQTKHQHPGPASHSFDPSGLNESHSSEDAASESSSPSIPSPSCTNCPNGGPLDLWMVLDNPTGQLWCDFVQQFTTEPVSLASLADEVAGMTLF